MSFTEEWFAPESQSALVKLYEHVRDLTGDVVEVGCWEGRSTVALANACHPDVVHAVDTWDGSPGEVSWTLAHERDVAYQFAQNIEQLTAGNVRPHRVGWRDYFAEHRDPVKFCHIDAEHSYREVFDNIQTVVPLLVSGGLLCGDDVLHAPVRAAVMDTLGPECGVVASLWWWRKP